LGEIGCSWKGEEEMAAPTSISMLPLTGSPIIGNEKSPRKTQEIMLDIM